MNDPKAFWAWFLAEERRFRDIETPEKELLLTELQDQLQRFNSGLWFEIGGHPKGPCELVITAEGDLSLFPEVRRLISAAPKIEGWELVAFKPAQGFEFNLKYDELALSPEATWFLPLESSSDPDALGLRVAYAHFTAAQKETFLLATYILLEAGLGELSVSEDIQHVEVCLAPSVPSAEGFVPLLELPAFIRRRKERMNS